MLSVLLRKTIEDFLARQQQFEPFTSGVEKLAAYFHESKQYIAGQSEAGDKLNSAASNLHSRFNSLRSVTREIVPQQFYSGIAALRHSLSSDLDVSLRENAFIRTLEIQLDAFVHLYDTYLMDQNGANAASLLLAANELNRQIIATGAAFRMILDALETPSEDDGSKGSISIVLESEQTLEEFGAKLTALASLYAELCQLFGLAPQTQPFHIRKIESGSFWLKGEGDAKVMALMAHLIQSVAGFLYRRYTTEGKLAAVPRNLEGLKAAVDIVAKLKEMGVDTSESDENLRKATASATRDLEVLLDGETDIRVNGQSIRLADHAKQHFLSQSRPKRIAGPQSRIEPSLDGTPPDAA